MGKQISQKKPEQKLLVVPISIKGIRCEAIVDTGITFSLIQDSLWSAISRCEEAVQPAETAFAETGFGIADGMVHRAQGEKTVCME